MKKVILLCLITTMLLDSAVHAMDPAPEQLSPAQRNELGIQLLQAINARDYAGVERLLKIGAPAHFETEGGSTPLIRAVLVDELEITQLLISSGANVKQAKSALLIPPTIRGNLEMMRLLIKNGAGIDYGDNKWNNTPLIHAAAGGNLDAVKLLLENNADVNRMNNEGITALSIAKKRGNQDIINLLIEHGAQ